MDSIDEKERLEINSVEEIIELHESGELLDMFGEDEEEAYDEPKYLDVVIKDVRITAGALGEVDFVDRYGDECPDGRWFLNIEGIPEMYLESAKEMIRSLMVLIKLAS